MQIRVVHSYDTVVDMMILLVCFIIFLQLLIFSNRWWINVRSKRKKKLSDKYQLILGGVFYVESETLAHSWSQEKDKLVQHFVRHYMTKDFNRKVLVDELLLLHRTFKGALADRTKELYYALGLDKTGIQKLSTGNATVRANVIRDLAQMEVKAAIPAIRKQLNHPSSFVQLEARIALFKLDDEQLFGLLDKDYDLSKWEQIKLFEVFRHFKKSDLPLFHKWLSQNNASAQIFCLELIAYFKQFEAADQCMALLKSANIHVRLKALQVLAVLHKFDFLEENIAQFEKQSLEEQIAVMHCIAASANEKYEPFARELVCKTPSKALAVAAGKSLLNMVNGELNVLENRYSKLGNLQMNSVINHLKTTKIA